MEKRPTFKSSTKKTGKIEMKFYKITKFPLELKRPTRNGNSTKDFKSSTKAIVLHRMNRFVVFLLDLDRLKKFELLVFDRYPRPLKTFSPLLY
jgi:hypothetical protein